ncbi:MAG TPA: hypothetical protein VH186_03670 [Chloroflexia bacterium]|nr:hypothetical protein [Chloroflexia bacterium]
MPDENTLTSTDDTLETQAEAYLEAQEKLAETAYNASTITIVLGLMPADDHPQGRLGILSVRNDQDAPLFGAALRGEEVTALLETAPLAHLLTGLKALLPERVKKRKQKEKEKERQSAQTTPTASATRAKSGKQSGETHSQMGSETKSAETKRAATTEADREAFVTNADHTPPAQPEPTTGKTTQLTLF